MTELKVLLAEIFTSKKALAAIVGLLMIGAQKAGFAISEETLYQVLGVLGTYVLGQGIADVGKPAAEVASKTGPVVVSVFADNRIEEILRANPRLIPFAEKVLSDKLSEINETMDDLLGACTVPLGDTVVPKP
jgi:hypothetical protein